MSKRLSRYDQNLANFVENKIEKVLTRAEKRDTTHENDEALRKEWLKKNKPTKDLKDFENGADKWEGKLMVAQSYRGLGDSKRKRI